MYKVCANLNINICAADTNFTNGQRLMYPATGLLLPLTSIIQCEA